MSGGEKTARGAGAWDAHGRHGRRVGFMVTCLTDQFFPRAGVAAVRVLERLGVRVEFPADQTCCGQPMVNSGCHAEAREIALRTARVFGGHEVVVTPSASCAGTILHEYERLGLDAAERGELREFAGKVREFCEYVEAELRGELVCELTGAGGGAGGPAGGRVSPPPARAAEHWACHLRLLGGDGKASDRLLSCVPGFGRVELGQRDVCCGFGGVFAVRYPEVSGVMVGDKVRHIREADPDAVVCNEGGCRMNMEGACRREGVRAAFVSTAEIIAEAMGLMGDMPRE